MNEMARQILVGVIIGTSATLFGIFLGVMFSLYIENLREFLSNIFSWTFSKIINIWLKS